MNCVTGDVISIWPWRIETLFHESPYLDSENHLLRSLSSRITRHRLKYGALWQFFSLMITLLFSPWECRREALVWREYSQSCQSQWRARWQDGQGPSCMIPLGRRLDKQGCKPALEVKFKAWGTELTAASFYACTSKIVKKRSKK